MESSRMNCKFCGFEIPDSPAPEKCPGCGTVCRKKRRNVRPAGTMIGNYRILRLIGSGGSGDVYLCDNPLLMVQCAIKVLSSDRSSRDSVFVERLLREAKIAAALQRPDVVAVLDAGIDQNTGEPFIVMEYVDGESLEEVLRDGPLPEAAVLGIAVRIASVLAAAESLGIVHRDIKPGNILLTSSGDIKLADLGIAKSGFVTSDTISDKDILLGTPNYASPEQLRNSGTVDSRADIYSLGATMYHMLTGNRPFEADSVFNTIAKVLESSVKPINSYSADISAATVSLVNRMMAKDPDNRIQNTTVLLKELHRCMDKKRFSLKNLLTLFQGKTGGFSRFTVGRTKAKTLKFITPGRVFRDLFLCSAVLVCLLFAWFNFGRAYSEKISKENLARYEEMRKRDVKLLLDNGDYNALTAFLCRPETGSRSRHEIFMALLRNPQRHEDLLRLISEDVFAAKKGEDFLGRACAQSNCSSAVTEALIRSGADIDFRDSRGRTPLMKALLAGNIGSVNLLLKYGADVCLIDNEGRNILSYLPAKFSADLLDAILAGDVPINVADRKGLTPLMIYVDRFDSPDMVKLMIKRKFNINRKSHSGETALMTAVRRRRMASAEVLFLNNARFDAPSVKLVSKEYRLRKWMENKLEKGK